MPFWLIRGLAGLLVVGAAAAAVAAYRHLGWAAQDELYRSFHHAAFGLLVPAAGLLLLTGLRLAWTPRLWSAYPFVLRPRFWRWLLFGWLVVFFVLGFTMPGQDLARYPCRAACLLWFSLLLTPLLVGRRSPATRMREHTDPATRMREHTDPASRLREHTDPASRLREHTDPASRLHEHTDPASRLREHTDPASRLREHTDPASRLREHTDPASRLREHTDPASRMRKHPGLPARLFPLLDLAVGNVVVLTIALELALRLLAWWSGADALLLNRTTGYRLRPGLYANGLRANGLGFADTDWTLEPPSDRLRLAALGDSFSVGVAVAYEDNWLTLLETELDTEVCNFGVCGTGPREYRELLASLVWQYQPNLVLVPIFIGNDITEWIASPRLSRFHPDALYVELLARRGVRLLREVWRKHGTGSASANDDFRMGVSVGFSEKTFVELTAGRLVVCRARPTGEDHRRWQQVEHHLQALIADCKSRGVPVAFVLIPDEFQVNAVLRRKALAQRGWEESELDLELPQRRLTQFLIAQEVPVLDLLPALKRYGPEVFIPNDGHFSRQGHRLAAQEVGSWLCATFPNLFGSDAVSRPQPVPEGQD